MAPLIGPIGLDYVAASADKAGIDVEVVDLGLAEKPEKALKDYFSTRITFPPESLNWSGFLLETPTIVFGPAPIGSSPD
jgi:hypothetical protein